jgi:putative Ca2+/H+ antiporter (TMEM165/GDT1 family)
VVAAITTVNFFAIAYALWRKPDPGESKMDYPASKAMLVSFAAIFFSEWGDIGQVTAATLAARFPSPLVVWIGAVGAMVTKGALAAFAGARVRQWIQQHVSPKTVRYVAVGLMLLLGLLSVIGSLLPGIEHAERLQVQVLHHTRRTRLRTLPKTGGSLVLAAGDRLQHSLAV